MVCGPGFVVFLSDKSLHITTGFLVLNLWSYAGDEDRANVNAMTLQPFINYNLPKGWYLTSSPLMTANWEAEDDNRWTVPIGGGFGRIFKIGDQPVNANIAAYYNVMTPDDVGANWQSGASEPFPFPNALSGRGVDTTVRRFRLLAGFLASGPEFVQSGERELNAHGQHD